MRRAQCVLSGWRPIVSAVVEHRLIERSGLHGLVEAVHFLTRTSTWKPELVRELADRGGLQRRKDGRHEVPDRLGVDDRIGDLLRLLGNQPAPHRIALRPEILALVVEAPAFAVDDDAQAHAVDPRHDAAVEFGSPCVDGDGVALRGIADRPDSLVEQGLEDDPGVVGGPADDEVVGSRGPTLLSATPGWTRTRRSRRSASRRGTPFAARRPRRSRS